MTTVPDFQSMMLPTLEILADGKERDTTELCDELAARLKLSGEQRNLRHEKSGVSIFRNNLTWAVSYLFHAQLLVKPRRGFSCITETGKKLLQKRPEEITIQLLKQGYPEFAQWLTKRRTPKGQGNIGSDTSIITEIENKTPEEILEETFSVICSDLATDILELIRKSSWQFFERLVVDVLTKMGYGGSRQDAGRVIGKSGDNGIDGLINEDKLGLDVLYIQAKKYDGPVPVSQVRDFAGALLAKKAKKGIFITTSTFPKSALEFVSQIEPRIILIDGEQLAQLMLEYNVGVSVKETYEIKRIDNDYFEE